MKIPRGIHHGEVADLVDAQLNKDGRSPRRASSTAGGEEDPRRLRWVRFSSSGALLLQRRPPPGPCRQRRETKPEPALLALAHR